jgi:hypothetical protein
MKPAIALILALLLPAPARADVHLRWGPADPAGPAPLELPLVDAPFSVRGGLSFPSMSQSLWIAGDAYTLMHVGLSKIASPWDDGGSKRWLGILLVASADLLTLAVPPFLAWQHEEWHRAVMANRGIDSFDDVYRFQIFASSIAVSHVKDEDLIRLKAEHPADLVRLGTAGIEGNYELAYHLERQAFFAGSPSFDRILIPLLYLQNTFYLQTCATDEVNRITDEENASDGANVEVRDFTGADCTGWVYDLFRPDEPYTARGTHPSGVGLDRYRKLTHLTQEERDYLGRQRWLSLLNFLDLNILGVRGFAILRPPGLPPIAWSLAIRHLPTSFGSVIRADAYLVRGPSGLIVSPMGYSSGKRFLPGLDATLVRLPLLGGARPLALSARLALWLQPERQRYDAAGVTPGGLAGLRLGWALHPRLEPTLEIEAKSEGWVAGNVFLDRNLSVRAGLAAMVF